LVGAAETAFVIVVPASERVNNAAFVAVEAVTESVALNLEVRDG
jgi:hypothetical protein